MAKLTIDEIRKRFESSSEFNEVFDAFEQAIQQRIDDIELYRLLFWNHSLGPDELCLFGEKLAREFPHVAYETYMWLANVFEVTHSVFDNYELALQYYKRASSVRPYAPEPYLNAADCYEPDLNIPQLGILIEFLKRGVQHVAEPKVLYQRLAELYDLDGNDEMSGYYRRLAQEDSNPTQDPPTTQ